jgi:hypothetical protein
VVLKMFIFVKILKQTLWWTCKNDFHLVFYDETIGHKYIVKTLRRNFNKIIHRKEKGECMLECTQFERKMKLNIISKILTHNISFILNYF